eukprot:293297_1
MGDMGDDFKDLSHLIFDSVVSKWDKKGKEKENKNVIKTTIFPIFPRLKQVVICDWYGKYSFNWLEFLGAIQTAKSSIKYIIKVKTAWNEGQYPISERIKKAFGDKKWNIQKETTESGWDIFAVIFE